jgi:hypothetical protein
MKPHQQDAIEQIIALARANGLSASDISAAMTDKKTTAARTDGNSLSRLLGFIGGIFIFAGICIFVGMQWDNMGSAARVVVTLGTGYVLFLMALAAMTDSRYTRAATPLFLMSAALQPGGVLVMLQEYSSGGDPRHGILFMSAVMLAQYGFTFIARDRGILAFAAILFGCIFFGTLCDVLDTPRKITELAISLSILSVAWAAAKSKHAAIAPFWFFVGTVCLFVSFFDMVEKTPFEILFLGLSALMVYASTVVKSRTLLFTATIAMLCYIGYFTDKHFSDVLAWPVLLMLFGLLLVGLSAAAVKISNKYIKA